MLGRRFRALGDPGLGFFASWIQELWIGMVDLPYWNPWYWPKPNLSLTKTFNVSECVPAPNSFYFTQETSGKQSQELRVGSGRVLILIPQFTPSHETKHWAKTFNNLDILTMLCGLRVVLRWGQLSLESGNRTQTSGRVSRTETEQHWPYLGLVHIPRHWRFC